MANKVLWDAAIESRGQVLNTELNSLADGAWSTYGSEFDNSCSTMLMQHFSARLNVDFAAAPTTGGFVTLYAVQALDGTNYPNTDTDCDPRATYTVASIEVIDSTSVQIRDSGIFLLRPAKTKFSLKNSTGQAFPASGSSVTLYSMSDEIQ